MVLASRLRFAPALILLALLCVARYAFAFEPEPFEARFDLAVKGFTVGETRWRVHRVDDGFVYETRTKATGFAAVFGEKQVLERSEWKRFGDSIKPASYHYERSGRPDKTTAISFDWKKGVVKSTRRGQTSRMSVPGDALDKLGYMLVLMEDLEAGKRSVRYQIADGKNRMKIYDLKVVGEERMRTALGNFEVLKIVRDRQDDDRETVIWVAPKLGYMPVRIEHRERDDESVTISIKSLSRASLAQTLGTSKLESRNQAPTVPDDKN